MRAVSYPGEGYKGKTDMATCAFLGLGVMGGPMQAQGHVQMVLRTQVHGQDVQTAVDAPSEIPE